MHSRLTNEEEYRYNLNHGILCLSAMRNGISNIERERERRRKRRRNGGETGGSGRGLLRGASGRVNRSNPQEHTHTYTHANTHTHTKHTKTHKTKINNEKENILLSVRFSFLM